MKIKYYLVLLLVCVNADIFSQSNKLGINIYGIGAWGTKLSFSVPVTESFGVWPNYSLSIRKERKDLFSFSNYELSIYYNFISNEGNDLYISTGVGYNKYHLQDTEGNATRYVHRDDGISLGVRVGTSGFIKKWGLLNFEISYHRLYSKVQYKYLTYPITYSERNLETFNIITLGVGFGFLL